MLTPFLHAPLLRGQRAQGQVGGRSRASDSYRLALMQLKRLAEHHKLACAPSEPRDLSLGMRLLLRELDDAAMHLAARLIVRGEGFARAAERALSLLMSAPEFR